jgi:hypothetical protein
MLGADVVVAHAAGLFDRIFQDLLGGGGKINLGTFILAKSAQFFDHFPHPIRLQAEFAQNAPGNSAVLLDQTQEQVFGSDCILV